MEQNDEIEFLESQIELLEAKIYELKGQNDRMDFTIRKRWKLLIETGEKANWYEQRSLVGASQWSYAKAKELQGSSRTDPRSLWIQVPEQAMLSEMEFQRLVNNFKNLSYDAIVVTFGNVEVKELDDEQLRQSGLARITKSQDVDASS